MGTVFSTTKSSVYEMVVRISAQHEDPEGGSVVQQLTIRKLASKKISKKSGMRKREIRS
jgi:hypothetical protein